MWRKEHNNLSLHSTFLLHLRKLKAKDNECFEPTVDARYKPCHQKQTYEAQHMKYSLHFGKFKGNQILRLVFNEMVQKDIPNKCVVKKMCIITNDRTI